MWERLEGPHAAANLRIARGRAGTEGLCLSGAFSRAQHFSPGTRPGFAEDPRTCGPLQIAQTSHPNMEVWEERYLSLRPSSFTGVHSSSHSGAHVFPPSPSSGCEVRRPIFRRRDSLEWWKEESDSPNLSFQNPRTKMYS